MSREGGGFASSFGGFVGGSRRGAGGAGGPPHRGGLGAGSPSQPQYRSSHFPMSTGFPRPRGAVGGGGMGPRGAVGGGGRGVGMRGGFGGGNRGGGPASAFQNSSASAKWYLQPPPPIEPLAACAVSLRGGRGGGRGGFSSNGNNNYRGGSSGGFGSFPQKQQMEKIDGKPVQNEGKPAGNENQGKSVENAAKPAENGGGKLEGAVAVQVSPTKPHTPFFTFPQPNILPLHGRTQSETTLQFDSTIPPPLPLPLPVVPVAGVGPILAADVAESLALPRPPPSTSKQGPDDEANENEKAKTSDEKTQRANCDASGKEGELNKKVSVIKKEADEENKEKEPMAKGGKDDAPEKGDEGGDGKGEVAVGQQPIQQKVSSDSIAPYRASPAPACFGRRGGRGRGGGGRQKFSYHPELDSFGGASGYGFAFPPPLQQKPAPQPPVAVVAVAAQQQQQQVCQPQPPAVVAHQAHGEPAVVEHKRKKKNDDEEGENNRNTTKKKLVHRVHIQEPNKRAEASERVEVVLRNPPLESVSATFAAAAGPKAEASAGDQNGSASGKETGKGNGQASDDGGKAAAAAAAADGKDESEKKSGDFLENDDEKSSPLPPPPLQDAREPEQHSDSATMTDPVAVTTATAMPVTLKLSWTGPPMPHWEVFDYVAHRCGGQANIVSILPGPQSARVVFVDGRCAQSAIALLDGTHHDHRRMKLEHIRQQQHQPPPAPAAVVATEATLPVPVERQAAGGGVNVLTTGPSLSEESSKSTGSAAASGATETEKLISYSRDDLKSLAPPPLVQARLYSPHLHWSRLVSTVADATDENWRQNRNAGGGGKKGFSAANPPKSQSRGIWRSPLNNNNKGSVEGENSWRKGEGATIGGEKLMKKEKEKTTTGDGEKMEAANKMDDQNVAAEMEQPNEPEPDDNTTATNSDDAAATGVPAAGEGRGEGGEAPRFPQPSLSPPLLPIFPPVDVAAAADQVDDNEEDQKEEETENDGLTDEADSVYQEGEVIDMESEEEAVEELNGDDDEEEEDIPIEVLIFNHTSTYSSGKLPSLMVTVDHLDETTIYEKETKEEEEVEEEDVVEDGAFFFY